MSNAITIKGFVYKQDYGLRDDTFVFFNSPDMADRWNALVGPAEFTYEIPADFNPQAAKLAALEKERESVAREFAQKVAALDKQIAELQALTNEVEA